MNQSFKNRMRKVLIALCLVWGLGITVPIHADDETQTHPSEITLTIDDALKDHTFTAYQIFTGDVDGQTISNVKWGNGVNAKKVITAFTTGDGALITEASGDVSAKDVAEAIATHSDPTQAKEIAALLHYCTEAGMGITITDEVTLTPGYYLIVDSTPNPANDPDFTWNETLLQLTGNMKIEAKTETPLVDKKAWDNDTNTYEDEVDHHIGDPVQFQYVSDVPNTAHYDKYEYTFHDKLSTGLTLDSESIKVYIGNDELPIAAYTVETKPTDSCSFHVKVPNLKGKDGQEVKVTYSATLNANAFVGLDSTKENLNRNSVYLEYFNDPYDTTKTGKTPEDEVYVYTYKIAGTKVDSVNTETKLQGAEFVLFKNTTNENGTEVKSYAQMDEETHKLTGWVTDENSASHLVSNGEGEFEILGLDAGTYYLKEIKAPTGYNIMDDPQPVVISNTKNNTENNSGDDTGESNTSNDTNTVDPKTGVVNAEVKNGKGFEMPSTGAVGQTMIYGAGALLAIGGLSIRVIRHRKED